MSAYLWFAVAVVLGVAVLVPLEGVRQRRRMRRRGDAGTGSRMMGAGMLELQHLLQADRHVVTLERQQKQEETEAAESASADGEP